MFLKFLTVIYPFKVFVSNLLKLYDYAEEIMGLKSKQKDLDEKRRGLLNKILDIKGIISIMNLIILQWSNVHFI